MRNDERNPKVEVWRDDLLYAVNTLRWAGERGEIVDRLADDLAASEPEGGSFTP